jgi:hypothetical protein
MIIARDLYEKGVELEKQKPVVVKEEKIPNLKTVKKTEPIPKKSKKKVEKEPDSDSDVDEELEEFKKYLALKRKYNKKK